MTKAFYDGIGRRVREHRANLGMTLEDLAERASRHPTYIGQVERGGKRASLGTLVALARALDISVADLLSDSAPPPTADHAKLVATLLNGHGSEERTALLSVLKHLSGRLKALRSGRR